MWLILVIINSVIIISDQNNSLNDSANVAETRIFRGEYAQDGQFPWMVYIKSNKGGYCGGSLISDSWILTAAKCIKDSSTFSLVIGATVNNPSDPRSLFLTTNTSIIHNKYVYYNFKHIENNIGLLKLQYPISETEFIKRIRIPKLNAGNFEHSPAIAIGWGATGTYNFPTRTSYAKMNVISNTECKKTFPMIIDSDICCKGSIQQATAEGDYGGPLIIYEDDGKPTLIGIISYYKKLNEYSGSAPSAFTRLTSFLFWIHEKTGIPIEAELPKLNFDGRFPWMVYIITNDGDYCGGSLISSSWVLTSAECIIGKTSFIIVAASNGHPGSETVFRTTNISVVPETYPYSENFKTVGLLKLLEPIFEDDFIRYIRLPTVAAESFDGTTGFVLGWSKIHNVNSLITYATLDIISNKQCAKTYREITNFDICYSGDLSQTTSKGARGGPLIIYEDDGQPTIIGLIKFSSGKNNYSADAPSGFTKLTGSLYWIHEKTGILIGGMPNIQFDTHFPWMVYIKADDGTYFGGSLISSTWILTSAECIRDKTSFVIAVGSAGLPGSKTIFRTTNISLVPDTADNVNTIGLIKLLEPILENDFIKYIRLPSINSGSFDGTTALVIGWDIAKNIKSITLAPYATLEIVSNKKCQKEYSEITDYDICYKGDLSQTMDQGAHGGPLIIYEADGKPTIIGLISFSSEMNKYSTNAPSGFIRLTSFLQWIHEQTGISIEALPVLQFNTQFPWMVYIKADGGDYCAGVLISSSWVLTTAECIRGKKTFSIATRSTDQPGSETVFRTSNISLVSKPNIYAHNVQTIGLIKLLNPIFETDFVKYIRLPSVNAGSFEGSTGIVIGWSTSNKLNPLSLMPVATLEIVSNKKCQKMYSEITDFDICYKGDLSETNAQGARGGPLIIYEEDGEPTIIGLITFATEMNKYSTNAPSAIIRLTSFLYWIQEMTGILLVGLPFLRFDVQFPWMVYIKADGGDYCAGVLISSSWILTTAECVKDKKLFLIAVGVPMDGVSGLNSIFFRTNTSIIHEGFKYFNGANMVNNIGLIKVPNDISENVLSKPINLPKLHQNILDGTPATAAGWERPESDKQPATTTSAEVEIIPNDECKKTHPHVRDSDLCSELKSGSSPDTKGGPLVKYDENGKPTIIGLSSFHPTKNTFANNTPMSFNRVTSYLDWIIEKTGIVVEDGIGMLRFNKQYPWVVYIKADDGSYFGGALISRFWIVTDADCIKDKTSFLIATGAIQQDPKRGYKTTNIGMVHKDFTRLPNGDMLHNIGLIKLLDPVDENEFVKPVRLPKINSGNYEGTTAIPIGWNVDKNAYLLEVISYPGLEIVSNRECKKAHPHIGYDDICYNGNLSQKFTQGAHGSSLIIYEDDGKPTIIGISFPIEIQGDSHLSPNGFTRLTTYLSWIQLQTLIVFEFPAIYFHPKFPWLVYILKENGEYCAGALISRSWILTTSECINNTQTLSIVLGTNKKNNPDAKKKFLTADRRIIHEEYKYLDDSNIKNNIGLLKLQEPISENAFAQPIRLPKIEAKNNKKFPAIAVGWGKSESDKSISVPIFAGMNVVPNDECRETYPYIEESELCSQVHLPTKNGTDSAPLIKYEKDGKPTLIGLRSVRPVNNNNLTHLFTDFTRVSNYMDWINDQTDNELEEESPTLNFDEQFPWMVYIKADDDDYCGGALISNQWIVTAAQCIKDKEVISIVTGKTNDDYPDSDEKFLLTDISLIPKGYPYSSDPDVANNIALVRMLKPIQPSDLAKPIRLPKMNSGNPNNTTSSILGWDLDGDVNTIGLISKGQMVVIPDEECKTTYSSITASVVCCKGNLAKPTVQRNYGDSLVKHEMDKIPTLIGIMTFYPRSNSYSTNSPTGFTKITSFLKWIHQETSILIEYIPRTCRTDDEQMEFEQCYNTCAARIET